jgi:hypothetical protein
MKTHRQQVLERYGMEDRGYSIPELSELFGYSEDVLQQVYNRGIGAHRTSPLSVRMKGSFKKGVNAPMSMKLSPQQWARARIWSFLNNSKLHDNDLR